MHRIILQTAVLWVAAIYLPAPLELEAGNASPTSRILQNAVYGKDSPEAQVLSAHLVQSPQPSPVLVQIISGGWNSSPPQRRPTAVIQPYLDAGISVVVVAHRSINDTVHWPAPADDVARAIQFIRAHLDGWGIDPKRIAVTGRSFGGHVALMVGFGSDRAKPDSPDPVERQSSRHTCILAGSAPTDLAQQKSEQGVPHELVMLPSEREMAFLRRHLKLADDRTAGPTQIPLTPPPGRVVHGMGQWEDQTMILASAVLLNSTAASSDPRSSRAGNEARKSEIRSPRSEVEQSRLASAAPAQGGSEKRVELAKWDDAAMHRSQTGPGGTEWDAQYRSFIQTDESATSKGFPTHAEAVRQILADAAKSPDNLRRHKGWVLFIKHFSQAYRPDPATADLKRLYEGLVAMEFGGTTRKETLPFDNDPRLNIHRHVIYGKTAPDVQRFDAYLVKSERPTPVLLEFHGGGWRRGAKSQFTYPAELMESILAAGISVISVDYRLTPKHPFPAQVEDAARAVQFARSKAKEWNLDPERIVAMGGSAGAHLSAWVALHDDLSRPDSPDPVERHSTRLRGFVDLWGPMDLTRVRPTELAKAGLRGADFADAFTAAFACTAEAFERDPDVRRRVREASPFFLVTRDDPPALIVHAAGEDMAPGKHPPVPEVINDPHSAWHGVLLADAMREAGIEVVCRIGPQVGKDLGADNETIVRFIQGCLRLDKNPQKPQR